MTSKNPLIALLGGSGLGPWVWERVTTILNGHGFGTLCPRLRATGDDLTPAGDVTLADWIDDLTTVLNTCDSEDVVLVAHSFAGYVAAGAIERGARVKRAVLLDAALPKPGRSWFQVMGPGIEGFMSSLAQDGAIPFFSREQLDHMYPGHGISDTDWAWMQPRLTPQPIETYTRPAIQQPLPAAGRVAYVRCQRTTPPTADPDQLPAEWTQRTLDAGHWPMVTVPEATAAMIEELATA